ncbi:tRNA (adenine(22)-N(1))-methyltransferase [Enterovibrio coralii]|uniref:SAM-dependent methyltransferase n=1 Tax=Enterovibrio coralii TaxID=294935 RepID=A0A135IDP9_9GAMM|nr:tRNA (adenine(22)-N(1))-methyltransferase TrmK [Enterovibrio coralii]KXF83591.1 hypothetical protein ATN88_24510 [Enterovibrio coralii]
MKIGKRLNQLHDMVNEPYDHIWDCCCDHGLLGAALLNSQPTAHIHFVDVVPTLIDALSNRLKLHFPENYRWEAVCMDAGQLPLATYSGRHLVIIAGIGGDLMMDMLSTLQGKNPDLTLDFLLCPVHHQYALRELLIARQFKLKEEKLVEENSRFYEMLLVTTHDDSNTLPDVTRTGSRLWLSDSDAQRKACENYLANTLAHYQRIQRGKPEQVSDIVTAYEQVRI